MRIKKLRKIFNKWKGNFCYEFFKTNIYFKILEKKFLIKSYFPRLLKKFKNFSIDKR